MKIVAVKYMLCLVALLGLGCAHQPRPRAIVNPSDDKLSSESKERFSEERLMAIKKAMSEAKIEGAAIDCRLGDSDKGMKALQSMYKKMEMNSSYWLTLGNCSIQKMDFDRAYYFFKIALTKAKNKLEEARVFNNLGVLLWKKNNYKDAVSHFLEAKNRAPLLSPIFNLCSLYLIQRQYSLADEIIAQAPKELQGDPEWKNLVATTGKGQ